MQVRVLYFGPLREVIREREEQVTLPHGCDVSVLLNVLRERHGETPFKSIAVAVNEQYATPATGLEDGDEVALLPPVSGGTPARARITNSAIDAAVVLEDLATSADGAVVTFSGNVRGTDHGGTVLALEYEAYEAMAVREMERILALAIAEHGIRDARVVHRVGTVMAGEASIFVAIAAAHRKQAFAAAAFVMDEVKRTVPIWKKEVFTDTAHAFEREAVVRA